MSRIGYEIFTSMHSSIHQQCKMISTYSVPFLLVSFAQANTVDPVPLKGNLTLFLRDKKH